MGKGNVKIMELSKVIKERRSVRHYNDKKLTREIIVDILEYAIMAPSAKNRQPWYFVVVQNQNKKEYIADLLEYNGGTETQLTSNVIRECAALVLVFADIEDMIMDVVSVGACIENMILRAKDLNVASLWIGFVLKIEEELKREFNLDKHLVSCVALGYTNHFPSKRPRKALEEVSEWF